MRPIVFIDTETCGLGLYDPIWEIAVIRRDDRGEASTVFCVEHDLVSAECLPAWFRADHDARYLPDEALTIAAAAEELAEWLRPNEEGKAIVVGSAPDFDMTRIQIQLGIEQIWNHHLIDAPTLAVGHWFSTRKARVQLPPSLDEAAKMFGINPKQGRHTALRDCELARDIFDHATHNRYRNSEVAA